MKQRIRLSILMVWSFVHLLLFAFNGFNFQNRLDSSGYSHPNSDSYKVYKYLTDELKLSDPSVVVVVDAG